MSDASPETLIGYIEGGLFTETVALREEISRLRNENVRQSEEIQRLKTMRVTRSESAAAKALAEVADMASDQGQQVLDKESAKQKILGLLDIGQTFTYSDLLDKLDIDLELLVEACEELAQEGKIGERRSAA